MGRSEDAGALCAGGVGGTGGDCPVQRREVREKSNEKTHEYFSVERGDSSGIDTRGVVVLRYGEGVQEYIKASSGNAVDYHQCAFVRKVGDLDDIAAIKIEVREPATEKSLDRHVRYAETRGESP